MYIGRCVHLHHRYEQSNRSMLQLESHPNKESDMKFPNHYIHNPHSM